MRNQQAKAKVKANELTAMLMIFVTTNAFLTYPRYISRSAYEAAWMETVISGIGTLVLFLIVEKIFRRYFRNLDIVEVSKEVFGRVGAAVVAVVFAVYFLCSTAAVVREFTENVVSTVLPATPILLVGAVFMFAVGYIAYAGLEGICRTAYIFLPILLVGTLGLCVATMNWWHFTYLFPLWGTGVPRILSGSLQYSSIFANVLLLTIVYPHVHDAAKKMRQIGFVSIIGSTALLTALVLTYLMVFPAVETGQSSFAMYRLARVIHLGPFFQRVESVFIFLWVTSATVKMAVTLWGAAYLIGKAFGWPSYRPGIPALSLISFSLGMWLENWIEVINLDAKYLMRWGWLVVFALPLAIVLVGMLGQKVKGNRSRPDGSRRRRGKLQNV
ncbi:GerAB/ArcD/ProY family transporter [Alicyclobacillus dauci]|uniref:Spore germination protein n=1 Tax=Alicyclobacillus dauci TaxID=1475485 RepID=A0ABY6Z3L6_9BACL|nr:endospore germination permease [Alicyclobacillus dauci]WAH36575.1 spore germination protein [Alicyclobacillus dauci]